MPRAFSRNRQRTELVARLPIGCFYATGGSRGQFLAIGEMIRGAWPNYGQFCDNELLISGTDPIHRSAD